ncbi:hypothetical protein H4582DRAFT_275852 [Lactarius indigo]|nr:hypothetical protein H4582DRAFT_275852 [Lactarius indigo]
MASNSISPPQPSSQSRPRVQSHKPRSICRNFVYHGVCRDMTCPRAHVPHSDMLDLVAYLVERDDFPPELRSVKQRLTPPNPETTPVRSNMPQFCSPPLSIAREMLAHAFLSRQHLRFLAATRKASQTTRSRCSPPTRIRCPQSLSTVVSSCIVVESCKMRDKGEEMRKTALHM